MNIIKKLARALIVLETTDDQQLIDFRLGRCNTCHHLKSDTCALCRCFVELKAESLTNRNLKGGIEITHCPIGRWGDKETADFYNKKS